MKQVQCCLAALGVACAVLVAGAARLLMIGAEPRVMSLTDAGLTLRVEDRNLDVTCTLSEDGAYRIQATHPVEVIKTLDFHNACMARAN